MQPSHTHLHEGAGARSFTLPDGTEVLYGWWGDDVEYFVMELAGRVRRFGKQTRMSPESAAELGAILDRADQAAQLTATA